MTGHIDYFSDAARQGVFNSDEMRIALASSHRLFLASLPFRAAEARRYGVCGASRIGVIRHARSFMHESEMAYSRRWYWRETRKAWSSRVAVIDFYDGSSSLPGMTKSRFLMIFTSSEHTDVLSYWLQ